MFVFVFLLTRQIGPRVGESKEEYEEKQLWRHVTISLWGMLFKVTVAFSSCQHKITGIDEQCRVPFSSTDAADTKKRALRRVSDNGENLSLNIRMR
ncbi:hypothetical protein DZS_45640 [Dickeya ananatis]